MTDAHAEIKAAVEAAEAGGRSAWKLLDNNKRTWLRELIAENERFTCEDCGDGLESDAKCGSCATGWRLSFEDMKAERDRAWDERDALAADTARYRFIKERMEAGEYVGWLMRNGFNRASPAADLDAAIDAALAAMGDQP